VKAVTSGFASPAIDALIAPDARAKLERFALELQKWGSRVNLVGSTERAEIDVHIEDSLVGARHLPAGVAVADLGSGAGFPGVPIAIARPDLALTLVESRERRVHFLRHLIRALDVPMEVRCERFERSAPKRFDVVCMRAVGAPAEILPGAAGWVREEGEIWLWCRYGPGEISWPSVGSIEMGERGRILRLAARSGIAGGDQAG
jgi:16S rRNA (guanine527-N7)-methyltransferase